MIDKEEVKRILSNTISDKTVCYKMEFRPSELAKGIKKIANIAEDYGFVFIGVEVVNDKYNIQNLSKGFDINSIAMKAIKELTVTPQIESECIEINHKNIYVLKIYKVIGGTSLANDTLYDENITAFIKELYNVCVKLQGNAKYISATEDERNDYVRDMLEQRNYEISDQTRRGISATGKASGEVDIFVKKDGNPFTVIEALNLSSLDRTYLSTHLNKIYSYDTTGNVFNVCLSYVTVKDFNSFWEKYMDYVRKHDYPYPILDSDDNIDNDYAGSEIKIMTTTHNRSGKKTILYHICVKILDK